MHNEFSLTVGSVKSTLPFLLKIGKSDPTGCDPMFQRSHAENKMQHRVSTNSAVNEAMAKRRNQSCEITELILVKHQESISLI